MVLGGLLGGNRDEGTSSRLNRSKSCVLGPGTGIGPAGYSPEGACEGPAMASHSQHVPDTQGPIVLFAVP